MAVWESALASSVGLIGGKDDGSRGRADGSRWSAKQSWAQDGSWEEGSGCCGGRPESQGSWQGTDGGGGRGQWAGQEAGCQRLGELLLQGQFRLQRNKRNDSASDPQRAHPLSEPHFAGFLPQGTCFLEFQT